MFSNLHISLNVVWYLLYSECCTWCTTSERWTNNKIFHLVLQVYCSPSLKEHLHNPFTSLLACIIERRASILRAHGVCVHVCVWWLCVNVCMYVCELHVGVCLCVHTHLCKCIQNGGYKSTSSIQWILHMAHYNIHMSIEVTLSRTPGFTGCMKCHWYYSS